jgi:hypothetical protein
MTLDEVIPLRNEHVDFGIRENARRKFRRRGMASTVLVGARATSPARTRQRGRCRSKRSRVECCLRACGHSERRVRDNAPYL